MKNTSSLLAVSFCCVAVAVSVCAEEVWTVGERSLPAPAHVSAELHEAIKGQPPPDPRGHLAGSPKTVEAMVALRDSRAKQRAATAEMGAKQLSVSYQRATIDGVVVYRLTPAEVDPRHAKHLFVHTHGGAYVFNGGLSGIGEGVMIAAAARMPVLSIDYRMPPEHPFPAAVDDVATVYTRLLGDRPAASMALGGTSAGGGLALAAVHKFKELGLEPPGALYAGTPWSDLTKTGDSYFTQEGIDHVLVRYEGTLELAATMYAGGHDLKEPLISPVYGDFGGFPPTFLVTGTRDLFLSNTARVHAKIRAAGGTADLMVFEGFAHADYVFYYDTPEARQTHSELNDFLLEHLGVE
jgi:acetyl esterase/lipase